jgi:hypothetical protein
MADIRPTVDDLGALMRARTRVRGGAELGTFRDAVGGDTPTRPTATEVEAVIDRVLPAVAVQLGKVPDAFADAAKQAVIYKVAQLIELGYWPEQNDSDQSTAAQYGALYAELVGTPGAPGPLIQGVVGDEPGGPHAGISAVKTLGRDGLADPAPVRDPFAQGVF